MATTYININGEQRDASALDMSKADRVFRDAWSFEGNVIEIDMAKAQEIHKDALRAQRASMLEAQDVKLMKALGRGEPVADIEAETQALRDVTADPRIAAAMTPAELKALTLEVLLG